MTSIYGETGGSEGERARASALVRSALAAQMEAGAVPALIGGDFSMLPAELGCAFALRSAGYADATGAPTALTSGAREPRRIDQLYLSPVAALASAKPPVL